LRQVGAKGGAVAKRQRDTQCKEGKRTTHVTSFGTIHGAASVIGFRKELLFGQGVVRQDMGRRGHALAHDVDVAAQAI
jgi:hypothetical protein